MKQYPHELMPVTEKMKSDIRDLNDHAGKLNVGVTPMLFMQWQLGNETSELHKCNSFTRNYYNALASLFTGQRTSVSTAHGRDWGAGSLNLKGYGSSSSSVGERFATTGTMQQGLGASTSGDGMVITAFMGSGTPSSSGYPMQHGIILGSDDSPEDFNYSGRDTDIILHHTSANGCLTYQAPQLFSTMQFDPTLNTYSTVIKRAFLSPGSVDIVVKDVLVNATHSAAYATSGSASTMALCIERSIFPEPITIPAGVPFVVIYTLTYAYPEPVLGVG